MSQLITIENQQTVLTPKDVFNLAWAVNYQLVYHYGRSPWVTEGLASAAHAMLLPAGVKPPAGSWNLILLDTTDQAGALGYHDDENGTTIPYSDVFVKTSVDDGAHPAAVASHEALEMTVDPNVDDPRVEPNPAEGGKLYIVEVGDPVQGNDYDVGLPEGRVTGTYVADFAYPAWWGLQQPDALLSFRNSVRTPFQIAPQGYISWLPAGSNPSDPNANWQQTFGERQAELPNWASRLPRIHGKP